MNAQEHNSYFDEKQPKKLLFKLETIGQADSTKLLYVLSEYRAKDCIG